MAFKVLYHEGALGDLEEIFDWSRQKHPETTEQFAGANHIDSLQVFPYLGAPVEGHANVRRLATRFQLSLRITPGEFYFKTSKPRLGSASKSDRRTALLRMMCSMLSVEQLPV